MPAIGRPQGHTVLDRETPPRPTREASKPRSTAPQLSFPNSPDLNRLSETKIDERHKAALMAWDKEVGRELALVRDALRSQGFTSEEIDRAERGQ